MGGDFGERRATPGERILGKIPEASVSNLIFTEHLPCAGHCARAVGTYEPSRSILQVVGLVKTPGSHEQKPNSASQTTKINLFEECEGVRTQGQGSN